MIDWQKTVLEIRRHIPCQQVDRKLGLHLDYTAKLARGEIREPKYSDGVRLLELHRSLCND